MDNCTKCRYCRQVDGGYYCDKIAERLLGLKGCGNFTPRSILSNICPLCGRTVINKEHSFHECITEG